MGHGEWFKIDGDNTLRLDYPLSENSLVWDVGGYKGEWADKIYAKYGCSVVVFEPVPEFYKQLIYKYEANYKIDVKPYGLGYNTYSTLISVAKDSSSTFRGNKNTDVAIADVAEEITGTVDLMKINIEGGEYDLLERLIGTGFIQDIKYIQIQFHSFIEDAYKRRDDIRKELKKTHELMWNYDFIWESWERK